MEPLQLLLARQEWHQGQDLPGPGAFLGTIRMEPTTSDKMASFTTSAAIPRALLGMARVKTANSEEDYGGNRSCLPQSLTWHDWSTSSWPCHTEEGSGVAGSARCWSLYQFGWSTLLQVCCNEESSGVAGSAHPQSLPQHGMLKIASEGAGGWEQVWPGVMWPL